MKYMKDGFQIKQTQTKMYKRTKIGNIVKIVEKFFVENDLPCILMMLPQCQEFQLNIDYVHNINV